MKSWPHWGQQKKSFWFHWGQDFTLRLWEMFSSSVVRKKWGRLQLDMIFWQAIHSPLIFMFTSLSDQPGSILICTSVDLQCIFRYLWANSIFLSRHMTPNISCWVPEVTYRELCRSGLTMWQFIILPTLLPRGNCFLTCAKLITTDFSVIIVVLMQSR